MDAMVCHPAVNSQTNFSTMLVLLKTRNKCKVHGARIRYVCDYTTLELTCEVTSMLL